MNDLFKVELLEYVKTKIPDLFVAFLTGSRVDGSFNDQSDFDVYVLSHTRDFTFNELFIWEKKKIQIVHLPIGKIDEILSYDKYSRFGTHISSFAKGVILLDRKNYLELLIKDCQRVYAEGPPACPYNELKLHKIRISNLISDLNGNVYPEEKMILSHELYKAFIKFYLDYTRQWNNNDKHLARQLKKSNPKLSDALLVEMQRFTATMEARNFTEFISANCTEIGSVSNGYSRYSGTIDVKNSYLIISFTGHSSFYILRDFILSEVKKLLQPVPSFFLFRSPPLGDDPFVSECVYLVIDVKVIKIDISQILAPVIRSISSGLTPEPKIHYPVNLDLGLLLGGEKLIEDLFKVFNLLTNEFAKELYSENDSIRLALRFARVFENVCFGNDRELWVDFLEYLQGSWLSRAYDNGKIHSFQQITEAKDGLILKFTSHFSAHKNVFESIYYSSFNEKQLNLAECLKKLQNSISINNCVKPHQKHVSVDDIASVDWVVYKSLFNYTFGVFLISESQKSYLIYALIGLCSRFSITSNTK